VLRAIVILAAGGVVAAVYAAAVERNWFALRRHRIPCLPPGEPPVRLLHLSDLHLRAAQRRKQRFLRTLRRERPDLVVATGDLLGDARSVPATVEVLTELRANAPAMFVLGSNDYYAPRFRNPLRYLVRGRGHPPAGPQNPWESLVAGLERGGWQLINNSSIVWGRADVVGLDDAHIGRADLSVARPRSAPGLRLAVAHSPDVAPDLARLGYDLIVCGHTHGGQLRLPGVGALVTNCSLPRRMARGVHRVGRAWLHVSAGLGTSMYLPFRFGCRPETCVLELVPAETGD
jgi:predicted MPP superfamily phosphohydrolase